MGAQQLQPAFWPVLSEQPPEAPINITTNNNNDKGNHGFPFINNSFPHIYYY
jgi:hypothetical protein